MLSDSIEALFRTDRLRVIPLGLPDPLQNGRVVPTLYGRNAVYLAMGLVRHLTTARTVLVPSLTCGVEVAAIMEAGFNVRCYPLHSDSLQAEVDPIDRECTDEVAAVLVTHLFGVAQRAIPAIASLCKDRGIVLIEDCAHALGGFLDERPLGSFGDLAVFSLRKSIPLPHGGALVVSDLRLSLPETQAPPIGVVDDDAFVYFGQRQGLFPPGTSVDAIYAHLGHSSVGFGARPPVEGSYSLGLSDLARVLVAAVDVPRHISQRRTVFEKYLAYFAKTRHPNLTPLLDGLSPGDRPPFFPVRCAIGSLRAFDVVRGELGGWPVPFWTTAHASVGPSEGDNVGQLRQELMILPLAPELSMGQLHRICSTLGRLR